ncbi:CPBP family intramembrane metalloprotease [Staphylococcus epidermidis]|uniref:CPBP family glutamic-type intramembrane protease n=1 Tax=Staphylococcus epidermidis TaxID=1282 RepID=UPI0029ED2844|nr:CPBP family intramembrane metalloprotease [Staphylococcus epidermidis]MCG1883154.1 CPBP family intramembrane metalloprotease [Staphylococcus epidermidis]MCG2381159.1 CPBP family intramembrane metalloprotease [Staphylococcus epidermidis]
MVNFKIEKLRLNNLFISLSIVIITVIVLNISIGIIAYLKLSEYYKFLSMILTLIISFIIIPTYLSSIFNYKINPFKLLTTKNLFSYFTVLLILIVYVDDYKLITFYFFIALGEEFLFREVVFNILLNNFNLLISISIGSLLFALILHLNESLESNLLIRFPSSIILYVIRYKFKLSFSIITHWIYNIFIVVMR